ncbi:MAG TPA: hypothetical protein VFA83_14695 [Acidimicrobiales bacterium]|nr:hypothetical protein [Acidimicrobiales bacterium]
MKPSQLPKVSADAPVNEPHDLWASRAPDAVRDQVPQRIRQSSSGA